VPRRADWDSSRTIATLRLMNFLVQTFLAYAVGFSIASMPGPILALVATETLRRGTWSGIQASIAPVCVDAVVMVPLALVVHAAVPSGTVAVAIAVVGGIFLLWLGIQSLRLKAIPQTNPAGTDFATGLPSFLKGVLTHLMNPYPYLFWGTVGLPYVREGFQTNGVAGALNFPIGFWLGASSMNFLVVFLVVRSKRLLPAGAEPYFHVFCGLLLIAAAVFLIVSAVTDQV
jgi:threonine/homoserine/homoserine lactone efflux protein